MLANALSDLPGLILPTKTQRDFTHSCYVYGIEI